MDHPRDLGAAPLRLRWPGTALLGGALAAFGCSADDERSIVAHQRAPIVYGSDDRSQPLDAPAEQRLRARASVAFVPESSLSFQGSGHVRLEGPTLENALGVCPDEPFAQEPVISTCSGTLVARDLVLTAGHCVAADGCNGTRVVFGYALNESGQVPPLTVAQVATCTEIVGRSTAGGVDFALIRIDHTPPAVSPVPVRVGDRPLSLGQRLFVIGHPTGLPQKIAGNAWVSGTHPDTLDFFSANLDVFPGNSGGGVFDERTGELVGLIARGPDGGYVRDPGQSCLPTDTTPWRSRAQVRAPSRNPLIARIRQRGET